MTGDPLLHHSARDHWLCPGCGTFDGPISYRRCDACDDRPEVRAMGYVGAGTPHARMEATWQRMRAHEADVERLTDWTPISSKKTLEWAYIEAFEVLRAEVERLRQGLWDCAAAAGMDTDGDTGPQHLAHPDVVELALREVRQLHSDYDEALSGGLA